MKYTLTSYDPIDLALPKPPVPEDLINNRIRKTLEPLADYVEIKEEREVEFGDFLVVTTEDACIDGNPAPNFIMQHSVYHIGSGEMPLTFDEALIGMKAGETKDVSAEIKSPLALDGAASALTMKLQVEKILKCVIPELTDEFVAENFAPLATVKEFRDDIASHFGLPDVRKDDPRFTDMVLDQLALRLVEDPDPDDPRMKSMPTEAFHAMLAIDALADHLYPEISEEEILAQMPGATDEERAAVRADLGDEAILYARREASLKWLQDNSRIYYA